MGVPWPIEQHIFFAKSSLNFRSEEARGPEGNFGIPKIVEKSIFGARAAPTWEVVPVKDDQLEKASF
jgi:hypothetical protein